MTDLRRAARRFPASLLLTPVLLAALALAFAASWPCPARADGPPPAAPSDTLTLSPEVMARTKARVLARDPALMPALAALVRDADRAMTAPAESVILKPAPPPGGDLHDYWSADPDWPTANPCASTYDRLRLRRMSRDALTLALAWYLTGNADYAGKGTALIWSWCCDSVTRTRPDMAHAHTRPGEPAGQPTGIIETRDLIQAAEAARILTPSPAWSPAVTRAATAWFTSYLDWLGGSAFGRSEAASKGSHGLWYDAQVTAFALYAGDTGLARTTLDSARARMAALLDPDAPAPCLSTLQAMASLAAMAERLGLDLWHEDALRRAFDLARPDTPCDIPPDCADRRYPPAYAPLFHRAAMVYKDPRYREALGPTPRDDRALLFH
jgi:hypothetical protein